MSVLIKGMEMPKGCGGCPFNRSDKVLEICDPCPLVEVDDDELDAAFAALKGTRKALRIIAEAFCRPPETDIRSQSE